MDDWSAYLLAPEKEPQHSWNIWLLCAEEVRKWRNVTLNIQTDDLGNWRGSSVRDLNKQSKILNTHIEKKRDWQKKLIINVKKEHSVNSYEKISTQT